MAIRVTGAFMGLVPLPVSRLENTARQRTQHLARGRACQKQTRTMETKTKAKQEMLYAPYYAASDWP